MSDAVIFLLVAWIVPLALWFLGAKGLAVIMGVSMIVVAAIVELIWHLRFRKPAPCGKTVSKEGAFLPFGKFLAVEVILVASALGLAWHFWAMR